MLYIAQRVADTATKNKTITIREETWRRIRRIGTMDDTMDSVITRALDCIDRQQRLPTDE